MEHCTIYVKEFSLHIHLVILSLTCILSNADVFMESPMSINVTNGTEAIFCCKVRGITLAWMINGTTASDTDDIARTSIEFPGNDVVVSRLFISSNIMYNNTEIVCQVFTEEGVKNQSDPAILRIQGPPAAVMDIASEFFNNKIHLTWTPPFTLDLTGVDVNIHYDVLITVLRERLVYTLNCTACPLVTPEYSFPIEGNLDPCGIYSFSIEPFNDAGRGPAQLLSSVHAPKPTFSDDSELEVVVSPVLKFVAKCLNAKTICTATVQFNLIASINGDLIDDHWQFIPSNDTSVVLNTLYSVTITARNTGGSDDRTITLSTYDLQKAKIDVDSEPGSISVTDIKFAINSSAVGFLVVIVNESGYAEHFELFIKSGSAHLAVELGEGLYHVTLYDVEEDGEPQTSAAISAAITVPQSSHYEVHSSNDDSLQVHYNRSGAGGTICLICSLSGESLECGVIVYSNDEPSSIQYYKTQANEICLPVSTVTEVTVAVFNIISRNGSTMIDNLPVDVLHFGPAGSTHPPENNTKLTTILGTAVSSIIAVFLAVSLIVFTLIVCKYRKVQHSSEIVLQSNQVYDVVKQQQRSGRAVRLEPCSAYGVHEDADAEPEYETVL